MTARPDTEALAGRWVRTAEEDLLTARNMLSLGRRSPYPVVAFHSQQCAEKYIKALLTLRSVSFPRTHDLLELLRLVPRRDRFGADPAEAAFLGRFSVETRYPGDDEPVTRADARRALRIALSIRKGVKGLLPRKIIRLPAQEEE
jgi:HEPN domain-containing protein